MDGRRAGKGSSSLHTKSQKRPKGVALSQGQEAEGKGFTGALEDDDDDNGIMLSAPSSPEPTATTAPLSTPPRVEDRDEKEEVEEEAEACMAATAFRQSA